MRCIVFGEGFWTNVAVSLLPFTVIVGVSVFAHHHRAPSDERTLLDRTGRDNDGEEESR